MGEEESLASTEKLVVGSLLDHRESLARENFERLVGCVSLLAGWKWSD